VFSIPKDLTGLSRTLPEPGPYWVDLSGPYLLAPLGASQQRDIDIYICISIDIDSSIPFIQIDRYIN